MSDDRRPTAKTRGSGLTWAAIVIGWIVVGSFLYDWLAEPNTHLLRNQLKSVHFYLLELTFVLILGLTAINLPRLIRRVPWTFRSAAGLIAVTLLAFVMVTKVAPRTSRIFYDEQIYQSIGQNLSDLKLAQMCNEGNVEYGRLKCNQGEYNKQPYAYPYLLSLGYRLFGTADWVAFAINNLSAMMMVWALFFAGFLLFDDILAGLLGGLIGALIPHQLLWASTASVEPTSALFITLSLMTSLWFARERSTTALLWAITCTCFAAQFRPESIFAIPLLGAVILLLAPGELKLPRTWAAGIVGLVLSAGLIAHMTAVKNEGWGTSGPRMSTVHVAKNFAVNGPFYVNNEEFPLLFTLLAVAGLTLVRRRETILPAAQFILFWTVFLFFYAGSYKYGADVRYSLMTYPAIAILAGSGAAALTRRIDSRYAIRHGLHAIVGVILFNALFFMPLIRAEGEEAWGARGDVDFAKEFSAQLPEGSMVLTHNPNMFQVWGVSAAQASIALAQPDYVKNVMARQYAGGVYFHWNFWCNVDDPTQVSFCTRLLDRYPSELVASAAEQNYRYGFYKLTLPVENELRKSRGTAATKQIRGGPPIIPEVFGGPVPIADPNAKPQTLPFRKSPAQLPPFQPPSFPPPPFLSPQVMPTPHE